MAKQKINNSLIPLYAAYLGAEYGLLDRDVKDNFERVGDLELWSEKMNMIARLALMLDQAVKKHNITWQSWAKGTPKGDFGLGQTTENIVKNAAELVIDLGRIPTDEEFFDLVVGSFAKEY